MTRAPVEPVDAATVILVRHGRPVGSPWQCFMVRRHALSDFASDVFVFPGGKLDPADWSAGVSEYVVAHRSTAEIGDDERVWEVSRVAAIRELFEEAGVLLATADGAALVSLMGAGEEKFSRYREQIHSGELSLLELAQRERLQLAADRLHPFSRWITPESFTRRYDTRFFVAYAPGHQTPLHDAVETTDSIWISPGEALKRFHEGSFPLVFATEIHLERMARYRSIEEMIASVSRADLEPVMPKSVNRGGQTAFVIPGDEGY